MMLQSRFSIGIACSRSSAFPCGTPSITSSKTTSANSFAAIQCAAVAPTLPEPTTVTFFRIPSPSLVFLLKILLRPLLRFPKIKLVAVQIMKMNEASTLVALNLADVLDATRFQLRRSDIDRLVDTQPDHHCPRRSRRRILLRPRMQPNGER